MMHYILENPQGICLNIYRNRYYIETMNEGNAKCLYITSFVYGKKLIMEKLSAFSSRLYHTNIKSIKSYVVVNQKFNDRCCDISLAQVHVS